MDIIEYAEWSDGLETSKDPLLDPYIKQGFDDSLDGKPKFPNPYPKTSYKHGLWKRGWKMAAAMPYGARLSVVSSQTSRL